MSAPDPKRAATPAAWITHVRRRVDLKAVDEEARKRVCLAVCGARREEFIGALTAAGPAQADALIMVPSLDDAITAGSVRAVVYCPEAESTNGALSDLARLPFAVFVVRTGEGAFDEGRLATMPASTKPSPGTAAVYQCSAIVLAELRKYMLPDIVHVYRGDEIALAAAVPAFRPIVAARLTMDCAMNSLKIAAASAIADHIPVLGLITGGIASAGDTIAITALQMRMLLRIAAAYGKKAEFARILELLPVVGGGYGWRALAREAVGFIPIAGIPIKAAVAYAGTLVVGQAASHYYETGAHMSPGAVGALYREATERAKEFTQRFLPRLRKP
ncbi:MAG: hypothetical protein JO195_05725 [Candidatus Eremiobacteraeota bacterium]|nr:hypothetical protein [Candidatus Eremiobacteraeota bacterium]MBV8670328.1 hypothetical protein [Candidatus Eremiobacteraeota bacterium]